MKSRSKGRRWSGEVTRRSNALDLEHRVFTWSDPKRVAARAVLVAVFLWPFWLLFSERLKRRRATLAFGLSLLCAAYAIGLGERADRVASGHQHALA